MKIDYTNGSPENKYTKYGRSKNGGGKMIRVLFICKKRLTTYGISYGLLNSARFVAKELEKHGIKANVVEVNDNNDIDREVYGFRPTHVVIEALWVVPEKFEMLKKLHSRVTWIVRLHSKVPFLATESMAMQWIEGYFDNDIIVSFNNKEACREIQELLGEKPSYLPNIYIPEPVTHKKHHVGDIINVGCFGAVRILKNHLQQAMAAILFANKLGKKLNFYVNTTDTEDANNSVVKNLRALFDHYGGKHTLITCKWQPHDKFIDLVKKMDIGLQVSASESFNIVTADFVSAGVPIVVSKEVGWMPPWTYSALDVDSILQRLLFVWGLCRKLGLEKLNKVYLEHYSHGATKIWLKFLGKD